MTLLVVYVLLALVVSFLCSIAEAVLLSLRPTYIANLEHKGVRHAGTLRRLKEDLDRPLAAILSLNTIAHTVGAAGAGAQAAIVYGDAYVGLFSAILTFLILVLSEIIPKTLGATYWQQLAPLTGQFISGLVWLMTPFVWLSRRITSLFSPSQSVYAFSREEFEAMARLGTHEGHFDAKESRILANLMRLHDLNVRSIMTPRPVIFSVPEAMTVGEFFERHVHQPFSRIPVYGDDRDDITGFVLKDDLLIAQARDEFDKPLHALRRDFLVLNDTMNVSELFDFLVQERAHIALIVDEYGTVQGLTTLEDVVETLFGLEIVDEADRIENMQALARERWRRRARAHGIDPDALEGPDSGAT